MAVPLNTVAPAVTGTPTEDQVLSVDNGTWTGADAAAAALTIASGSPPNSAVTFTAVAPGSAGNAITIEYFDADPTVAHPLSVSAVGDAITITQAFDGAATSSTANDIVAAITADAGCAALVTAVAGGDGTGQVGPSSQGPFNLTGGADADPITFIYQWLNAGGPIGGATANTYTLLVGDVAASIHATVTAANLAGTTNQDSNTVGPIAAEVSAPPVNTLAPAVTGTLNIGDVLTTDDGTWTGEAPIAHTYQWQADSGSGMADIVGQTANTFTLTAAEYGASLLCNVTATNDDGTARMASNTVGPVTGAAPVNTVAPVISGTVAEDQMLSCTTGTWTGSAPITFTYQWAIAGTPVVGATAATYVLLQAEVGQINVTCTVHASNVVGVANQISNTLAGPIVEGTAVPSGGAAAVDGVPGVRTDLTASYTNESGGEPHTNLTYQWQKSDDGVAGWADVVGAVGNVFNAAEADLDKFFRVKITPVNDDGSGAELTSDGVGPIKRLVAAAYKPYYNLL